MTHSTALQSAVTDQCWQGLCMDAAGQTLALHLRENWLGSASCLCPHHRLPCHCVNASGSKLSTDPSTPPAAAGLAAACNSISKVVIASLVCNCSSRCCLALYGARLAQI
jgi:hypothetical protein